jgi:hypothetical protein
MVERLLQKTSRKEILHAFNKLEDEKCILKLGPDPGPGKVFQRGRPKMYYKITPLAFQMLLDLNEFSSAEDFWNALISLCMFNQINYRQVDSYYRTFEYSHLGHSPIYSCLFQSHYLESLLGKWFNQHAEDSSSVPNTQKVLECLALNRSIQLQKIIEITDASEQNIKKIFRNSTADDYSYVSEDETDKSEYYTRDNSLSLLGSGFIVKNKDHSDSKNPSYELTLLGVILVIALIRYHEVGVSHARIHRQRTPKNVHLFLKHIPLHEFYDKIVSNYKDKLPLIFGEWNLLKRELGPLLLYESFDFLYYQRAFETTMGTPVRFGGTKEFYDNIQNLAINSETVLSIIYVEGVDAIDNSEHIEDNKYKIKVDAIGKKLSEIKIFRNYADIISSLDWPINEKQGIVAPSAISTPRAIAILEGIISIELTFLFYLNLNRIVYLPSRAYDDRKAHSDGTKYNFESGISIMKDLYSYGSPKDRLKKIIEKSVRVRDFFLSYIKNVLSYQDEAARRMRDNCAETFGLNIIDKN